MMNRPITESEKKKKEIIEARKKNLKNKSNDKVTQITVINKSELSSSETNSFNLEETHSDIKKDVQMVKRNIEEKIKK